jgi:hypothetical protein
VLVRRPEGKKPLGRPGRRWKGNTKIVLQKVGWGNIGLISLMTGADGGRL